MADMNLNAYGGIGRGNTLPSIGKYHGQMFEYIADNLTDGVLYTWNDVTKKWSLMGGSVYKNTEVMPISVGGLAVGTEFSDGKTFQEIMSMLLYPYTLPIISLSSNPSPIVRECGNSVSNIVLNVNITKKSNNIDKVEYYKNGSLIYSNDNPSSGSSIDTYTDTSAINNTTTYMVKVYDDKPNSVSSSLTHQYVYPFYYGVGISGLTPIQVQGLAKIVKTKSNTTVTTSPNNEVYYFAYPKSYGLLNDVLDQNNFSIINDFNIRIDNLVCLDGTTQEYYIYEFKNIVNITNFTTTYKF